MPKLILQFAVKCMFLSNFKKVTTFLNASYTSKKYHEYNLRVREQLTLKPIMKFLKMAVSKNSDNKDDIIAFFGKLLKICKSLKACICSLFT